MKSVKYILKEAHGDGAITVHISKVDDAIEVTDLTLAVVTEISPIIAGELSQARRGETVMDIKNDKKGATFHVPHGGYIKLEGQFESIVRRECAAQIKQRETAAA